ncbi:DUF2523 domain-containing protein [Roseateles microcysteis]|uniref:DUF2523 domain-containing protein n=1 Tax=Roseateles microcysteis TaxID=3119057 RepID=UPI002FE63F7A
MPALLIAALWGGLIQVLGTLVGKVLVSLGIGYAVFSGVDTSITWARDYVISQISAQHAQTVAAASACKVGVCISILTSALVARLTINGLTGGSLKRFKVK